MFTMRLLVSLMLVCNAVAFTGSPTRQPTTVRPSRAPTTMTPSAKPTVAAPTYSPTKGDYFIMKVEQSLIGIDAATFNGDYSNNSFAVTATVADCLSEFDISQDDVTLISVSDATASARLGNLRVASSSIDISYEVVFNTAVMGYSNSEEAYTVLASNLTESVVDTEFDSFLVLNSADATALTGVTGGPVSSSSYAAQPTDDDHPSVIVNDKKRNTRDFEIGVIAGGGGFLTLAWIIVIIMNYFTAKHGPEPVKVGEFEAVSTKEPPKPVAEEQH